MKKILFTLTFALVTVIAFAQKNHYQLSSHILDISKGTPATGVTIRLEKLNEQTNSWTIVDEKITDNNGRVSNFLNSERTNLGSYKLVFLTSDYFKKNNLESFYPFIEVVFQIKDDNHYHVPITLSAYGYSTYRGN